ncbi:unnamed protein product, partial [Polarella glacialis]
MPFPATAHPPPQCQLVLSRWTHTECYCPLGLFWGDTAADFDSQGPSDYLLSVLPELSRSGRPSASLGDHIGGPWCSQRGLDIWGAAYGIYAGCASVGFLALAAWS